MSDWSNIVNLLHISVDFLLLRLKMIDVDTPPNGRTDASEVLSAQWNPNPKRIFLLSNFFMINFFA